MNIVFLQVRALSFEKKVNSIRWKHEFVVLERKNTFREKIENSPGRKRHIHPTERWERLE